MMGARQPHTRINASLGAVPGVGDIILAECCQVEDADWWEQHAKNAHTIVCCTADSHKFFYPHSIAATSQIMWVDAREDNERIRQYQLDLMTPRVGKALARGEDVVIHCRQAFHRAPVVAAALYQRLTGKRALVPYVLRGVSGSMDSKSVIVDNICIYTKNIIIIIAGVLGHLGLPQEHLEGPSFQRWRNSSQEGQGHERGARVGR